MVKKTINSEIMDNLNRLNAVIEEIEKTTISDIKTDAGNFFSYGEVSRTAYLNWRFDRWNSRSEQMYNMSEGYFSSASESLKRLLVDNYDKKADIWIFPILFSTIHAIELSLKTILLQLDLIENIKKEDFEKDAKIVTNTHDIQKLCERVIDKLGDKEFNQDWPKDSTKEFKSDIEFVLEFISFINDKTRDVTFVRYPFNNKNKNQFFNDTNENITIDLVKYFIWFHKVWQILDNVFYHLDDDIDNLVSSE